MTKSKFKILLSLFVVVMLVSSFSFATEVPTSENQAVTTNENTEGIENNQDTSNWKNTDLYISDYDVTVDSIVDGNAFIIGNNVTIKGEIGGDLFVLANKLTIENGYIYSNVFVCANEVIVNGVIYDLYATCSNFTLGANGYVYRDMRVNSNVSNIEGKVRRNAFISSSSININGESGTLINGNLKYSAKSEISIPDGVVSGEVTYSPSNVKESKNIGSVILNYLSKIFINLLYTFIIVMLAIWLAPKFLDKISNMNTSKSFIALGIGILAPIIFVIVSVILIISVFGSSIGLVLMSLILLIACIASSVTSIFFGKLFTKLLKMEGNVKFVLFTLLADLILFGLTLIPFVGGIVYFLIVLFGIGIVLLNILPTRKQKEIKE